MRYRHTVSFLPLVVAIGSLGLGAPSSGAPWPWPDPQDGGESGLNVQEAAELAAQEAEAAAGELEAVAARLEALAKEAQESAVDARSKAIAARRRADAARKRAIQAQPVGRGTRASELGKVPGSILRAAEERERAAEAQERRANGEGVVPRSGGGAGAPGAEPVPAEPVKAPAPTMALSETDKHGAMERTAAENKAFYAGRKRAQHDAGARKTLRRETMTFEPGGAPDMADLEIRAKWQWAINVARGGATLAGTPPGALQKSGHIDLARLLIGPDPDARDKAGMQWGMRRYNLGDVTVVDCDFEDIPKEHGIYDNLAGHGLYRGNTFRNLGGQGIQIAHRDQPYQQYKADNLPFYDSPVLILEDNHAVDCGQHASRSGFTWTFFDYGTHEHPSKILLRGCTVVHAWGFTRTTGGERVPADHSGAIQSPGGLIMHQFQHSKGEAQGKQTSYACSDFVLDNCLFDLTRSSSPVAAIRGVETILLEDSCFIAREHRNPHVDIDDVEGRPSGRVIVQNCVSPPEHEVWLRIRGQRVMSLHCPGKRFEIDVNTLKVTESEPRPNGITGLRSPLEGRWPAPGITAQPPGHVDDLGLLAWREKQKEGR